MNLDPRSAFVRLLPAACAAIAVAALPPASLAAGSTETAVRHGASAAPTLPTPAAGKATLLAQAASPYDPSIPPPLPFGQGGGQGGAGAGFAAPPPPLPLGVPQAGPGFQPQPFPQQPGFGRNGFAPQPGVMPQQPPVYSQQPPYLPQPGFNPGSPVQPYQQPQPQTPEAVTLPPGVDGARLAALAAQERQDFGVPPTNQLHAGAMHQETPTSIPGGKVIDTLNLVSLLGHQPPVPMLLLDVLGGQERLPGSLSASWASQPGSFNDEIEGSLSAAMRSATGGDPSRIVVVYCSDPHCWMSYNAALRIINLGYQNVFWYRGGINAWQQAGLSLQPQEQRQ